MHLFCLRGTVVANLSKSKDALRSCHETHHNPSRPKSIESQRNLELSPATPSDSTPVRELSPGLPFGQRTLIAALGPTHPWPYAVATEPFPRQPSVGMLITRQSVCYYNQDLHLRKLHGRSLLPLRSYRSVLPTHEAYAANVEV